MLFGQRNYRGSEVGPQKLLYIFVRENPSKLASNPLYSVLHLTLESARVKFEKCVTSVTVSTISGMFSQVLAVAMAPYTSTEMREKMVIWRFEQHKTAREIAILAGCSESTVYDVLRLHREYGQVNNPFARMKGHARILSQADIHYIHALLQANPSLYLDELQEQLLAARDVDISIATISRTL